MPASKDQGTEFEFTVVQRLNQGTNPGKGCNPCLPAGRFPGGLFLFLFWTSKKEKTKSLEISYCL